MVDAPASPKASSPLTPHDAANSTPPKMHVAASADSRRSAAVSRWRPSGVNRSTALKSGRAVAATTNEE